MRYYYYFDQHLSEEDSLYDEMEEYFYNILCQCKEEDLEADQPIAIDAYKEISRHAIEQNMEGDGDDPADMYGHQKELARLRQKKFYDAHKAKLLQKKRAERRELKRLRIEVVELQQAPAPAPAPRRRGNRPDGPIQFTDEEIEAKKKEARKRGFKFTPEIVTQQLNALLGTVNQTTHEAMKKSTLDNHDDEGAEPPFLNFHSPPKSSPRMQPKLLKSGQKAPLDTKLANIVKKTEKSLKKDFHKKKAARDAAAKKITHFWPENLKKVKILLLVCSKSVSKMQPKLSGKIKPGIRRQIVIFLGTKSYCDDVCSGLAQLV